MQSSCISLGFLGLLGADFPSTGFMEKTQHQAEPWVHSCWKKLLQATRNSATLSSAYEAAKLKPTD